MSANSPAEVHHLFTQYFSAGDLDSLLSLYESGATLAPLGVPSVSGTDGLRAAITGFLSGKPQLGLTIKRIIESGDIALLLSTWTLKGTDPQTGPFERAGQTSDVVRRQPDGRWLFVIDVPYGAEAAND